MTYAKLLVPLKKIEMVYLLGDERERKLKIKKVKKIFFVSFFCTR